MVKCTKRRNSSSTVAPFFSPTPSSMPANAKRLEKTTTSGTRRKSIGAKWYLSMNNFGLGQPATSHASCSFPLVVLKGGWGRPRQGGETRQRNYRSRVCPGNLTHVVCCAVQLFGAHSAPLSRSRSPSEKKKLVVTFHVADCILARQMCRRRKGKSSIMNNESIMSRNRGGKEEKRNPSLPPVPLRRHV